MKTVNKRTSAGHREGEIDVDALLAAINEISESDVWQAGSDNDPRRVRPEGQEWHNYRDLADAFELDIRDFSVNEINH